MHIPLARVLLACLLPCTLAAQTAILHIKILEGEGTVYTAGSRSPRPLLAQVTDETGRPVEGAAVTFRMPEAGPGGVFANGLRTEMVITDANGRAAVRNFQLNRTPGQFQIRIFAAKEQARAGAVSSHYITERNRGSGGSARGRGGSRRKWVALALVAAGAVGGGAAAAMMGGGQAAGPAAAAPAVTIGTPVITVGKP